MILNLPQKMFSMRVLFLLAMVTLVFTSCRDGNTSQSTTSDTPARTTVSGSSSPESFNQSDFGATQSTQTGDAQFHYICANNCEGSGANAAGTCPVCGEELIHNQAFHSGGEDAGPQIMNDQGSDFTSKINPLGGSTGSATPSVTGSAQFHYICCAGCVGGGNAQGSCPSCGASLVHNDAFHNTAGATTTPTGGATQAAPTSANRYPSVFNTPGAVPPANRINTSGGGGGGFHYICSAGCGGGGNAQGSCPSCGAALVHNDAFH